MATFLKVGLVLRQLYAGETRVNAPAVGSTLVGVQCELLSVRHDEFATVYTREDSLGGLGG